MNPPKLFFFVLTLVLLSLAFGALLVLGPEEAQMQSEMPTSLSATKTPVPGPDYTPTPVGREFIPVLIGDDSAPSARTTGPP